MNFERGIWWQIEKAVPIEGTDFTVHPMKNIPSNFKDGFSILELLAVMAVVAVLSVSALPAFNSFGASQGVKQGIYDVAGLLELARNEAVSRQSYVWVSFENTTNHNQAVLCMMAAAAKDGSANPAGLVPLTRMIRVKNAVLVNWADLNVNTRACFTNASPVSVAHNNSSITVSGPGGLALSRSITFTPRGEALLVGAPNPSTSYDQYIDVSFRQARGTQVLPEADDAALIVEGSTGAVQRIRRQ